MRGESGHAELYLVYRYIAFLETVYFGNAFMGNLEQYCVASGYILDFPRKNILTFCSAKYHQHRCTDKSPYGLVEHLDGVTNNQSVTPCQSTWSLLQMVSQNCCSMSSDYLKYKRFSHVVQCRLGASQQLFYLFRHMGHQVTLWCPYLLVFTLVC